MAGMRDNQERRQGSVYVVTDDRRGHDRRIIDRIRAFDPTILECGPQCAHFARHSDVDHAYNVSALVGVAIDEMARTRVTA